MADDHRGRCNLRCLPAVVKWFHCKIDPTDHLISSPIYHSGRSADSLAIWERDYKVPRTTQEMAPQTVSGYKKKGPHCHHSWGVPVNEWQSDSKHCFFAHCAEHRWPEIWIHLTCRRLRHSLNKNVFISPHRTGGGCAFKDLRKM